MTSAVETTEGAARKRAPRLTGEARRRQIVSAACEFFASNGFSGPTRDLAASMGVTQALLYRYFDNKDALIGAVFDEVFKEDWHHGSLERFNARAAEPMPERIVAVYQPLLMHVTETAARLLCRAGLDGYPEPISACVDQNWPTWSAMIDAWRREESLRPLAEAPILEGERALVLALHSAMIMVRLREHVFGLDRTLDDEDEVRQVAETHDAGARAVMHRLHTGQCSAARGRQASDTVS